ncbi:hypothetical protein SDC9_116295 [bioreactor metagenome]|uniref:Uncharacterized protein n=1 Tax=bioreactor metagenome TaxID=1076179 RepID=A0A645BV74_9ZZZZ
MLACLRLIIKPRLQHVLINRRERHRQQRRQRTRTSQPLAALLGLSTSRSHLPQVVEIARLPRIPPLRPAVLQIDRPKIADRERFRLCLGLLFFGPGNCLLAYVARIFALINHPLQLSRFCLRLRNAPRRWAAYGDANVAPMKWSLKDIGGLAVRRHAKAQPPCCCVPQKRLRFVWWALEC